MPHTIPTSNANIASSLSDYEDNSPKLMDRKDKDKEAINRFWYYRPDIELTLNQNSLLY